MSLSIIENYAKNDNRIVILNNENQGVSAARNAGLTAATGEYIMFLDSDDAYLPDTCLEVVNNIKQSNSEIICFGHSLVYGDKLIEKVNQVAKLAKRLDKAKLRNVIANQVFVTTKAFRRSFLIENNIKFPLGIKTAEDIVFCCLTYFCKPVYSYIPKSLYLYFIRSNSATNQNLYCIENDMEAYKYLVSTAGFLSASKDVKLCITNHFLAGSVNYWKNYSKNGCRVKYVEDICMFLNIVRKQFNLYDCLTMPKFRKLYFLILCK